MQGFSSFNCGNLPIGATAELQPWLPTQDTPQLPYQGSDTPLAAMWRINFLHALLRVRS